MKCGRFFCPTLYKKLNSKNFFRVTPPFICRVVEEYNPDTENLQKVQDLKTTQVVAKAQV